MGRFKEIDIVKGLAMLTVLWHHSFILYPVNINALPWCQHAISINLTFFMNVFFLVSGYLFAFSRNQGFLQNMRGKAKRLLVPYLSFSAVTLGMKLLAPALVNKKVESIGAFFDDLLLRGGELWFVYVLFLIFVIWPWVLKRMSGTAVWLTVFALIVTDFFVPSGLAGDLLMYKNVLHYSIFFVAGYGLKCVGREWLKSTPFFAVVTLLFLACCCIWVKHLQAYPALQYLQAMIGCAFVWMFAYRLSNAEREVTPRLNRFLTFVGRYSLPFYWFNGFVLVVARTLVAKVLPAQSSVAIALSIFLLCVAIETGVVLLVRKIPKVGMFVGIPSRSVKPALAKA